MKRILLLFIILSHFIFLKAQQVNPPDTSGTLNLDEVVISASKFEEKKRNVAQRIDIVSAKKIAAANAQNTGDLLINTGNVFVQKSQQGGSSPVLRGFEASRVLLVVDGVRMNNAIYRSGHLQNAITVDQNMLERIEVMFGPASTQFGSDALGGVIHLRTKAPKLSTNNKLFLTGAAFTRYSSANTEKTGHFDISIGGKKFAWLQAYTYSDFGDMKMGNDYPKKYPSFGRRDSLIITENGVDKVIANADNRIQRFSGYKQWDITQKLLFKQNERITHQLNFQLSNSGDVPRYDRLQDKRNFGGAVGTTLRFAEWYYGPQKRILGAYELGVKNFGFIDEFRVNINYQNIEESRQQREYLRYDRFDSRLEKLNVWGFNIDARKKWDIDELSFGIDGQLNDVKSSAARTNLTTGVVSKLDSRYPDGSNNMNLFGVYLQHLRKFKSKKWILNDGIRLQTAILKSVISDNSFFNLPYTNIEQNNLSLTGNIGVVFLPSDNSRFATNISSAFRAPNIDDLAKIFESNTTAKQVVFPNPDIKPEKTYNIDISFSRVIAKKIRFEATGFYTMFRNALAKAPFRVNGQDSIIYNGVKSQVLANQNNNKAYLYGFNFNITADFCKLFSFYTTINYSYGRYKEYTGIKIPLDHIPPVFGKTSITCKYKNFNTELFTLYNGWKKIKNYNPNGEDNQQYATADGMPSWFTVNWRGNLNITENFMLQAGVENIFDRNYRYFASGFSAPGRNIFAALRVSF
jgi:hemoglobin/transferrin/lactoferrin receptor protein